MQGEDPPHPVDIHVGTILRQARLAARMSQSALGKTAGVRFQQIQKYESGANRVSASRLWEMAKTLETPIELFFPSFDPSEYPLTPHEAAEEVAVAKWVRLFRDLPKDKRTALLSIAATIREL